MKKYCVIGGEYTDSTFSELVKDTGQEHGPFLSYKEAQDCWQSLSMSHIDNALARFQIKTIETENRYWVVGGIYTNTRFEQLDANHPGTQLGPFSNWEEAEKHWRHESMRHIDDALARFRIEMR